MTTLLNINTFGINFAELSSNELVHLIQLSTVELHNRTVVRKVQVQEVKSSLAQEAAELVNELASQRHTQVPIADSNSYATYNPNAASFKDHVEFIVNAEKKTVVALLRYEDLLGRPVVWSRGIAKCCPEDLFYESIGMVIALHRALGIKVPEKFIK